MENLNQPLNQEIINQFINNLGQIVNDIFVNQTCFVNHLISQNYDDFEFELKEDELSEDEDQDEEDIYKYDFYQAFLCSSYLMKKLEEKGELIINHLPSGEYWWGRGCCGQSIRSDYVIREIATDTILPEISEGLKRQLVSNIMQYQ